MERQEGQEFKAIHGYLASLRSAWAMRTSAFNPTTTTAKKSYQVCAICHGSPRKPIHPGPWNTVNPGGPTVSTWAHSDHRLDFWAPGIKSYCP